MNFVYGVWTYNFHNQKGCWLEQYDEKGNKDGPIWKNDPYHLIDIVKDYLECYDPAIETVEIKAFIVPDPIPGIPEVLQQVPQGGESS